MFHRAASNGKASAVDAFNAVDGISVKGFDLGDLLGVELSPGVDPSRWWSVVLVFCYSLAGYPLCQ